MAEDREIRPVHVREYIRTKNGLTFPIANSHVRNRRATIGLHHSAVLIFKNRNPDRAYSIKKSAGDRARVRFRLDEHRSTSSAIFRVGRPMPVLDTAISVQYRFVVPRRISRF